MSRPDLDNGWQKLAWCIGRCVRCGEPTSKPDKEGLCPSCAEAAHIDETGEPWVCGECGQDNWASDTECMACGRSRT